MRTGEKGLTSIDLIGIEQPVVHHEPSIAGATIRIREENINSITVDEILGNVSIFKTGDTPIVKMWTEQAKHKSGRLDCGYTYYALPIDQNCEHDYSYFDADRNGNIFVNNADSLAYENIGNIVPFAVYAENTSGYKSNQAKVMIHIIQNPDWSLKFQRPIIRIDSNISIGTEIGNVLMKKSQRELFLFDIYEDKNLEYLSCDRDSFYDYFYNYL